MSNRLQGKKAIVTGGSRGIGAAIARRLAAEGADVVITFAGNQDAANQTVAAITAAGRQGHAVQANASDAAQQASAITQAAEKLGGIDILVHNAGIFQGAPVTQDQGDSYDRTFATNVGGVHSGTAAAMPHLHDGGSVIIIGSINAHHSIMPGLAVYGATKAAVAGLARGWARDLASRNIRVNVIQPGPIDTDMNPADGDFSAALKPLIPLGRYGTADEVAALAAFLASDEASYITGTAIDIDGGVSA
ncbi:SDR family NAD(P)-dependent oxidoreductase [Sphingomonas sp. MMS24-J45]|uniref:SDR family NAD(P)-dependent oxidoreductase n=1 Tax=Sphingomonas sp. MMS24-J45 TaxID=3238806 RepID=UPI00384D3F9E